MPGCPYFVRYWAIYVLQLFAFSALAKIQDKNLDFLRTKTVFKIKQKAFLSFFNKFQLPKLRPDIASLTIANIVKDPISGLS